MCLVRETSLGEDKEAFHVFFGLMRIFLSNNFYWTLSSSAEILKKINIFIAWFWGEMNKPPTSLYQKINLVWSLVFLRELKTLFECLIFEKSKFKILNLRIYKIHIYHNINMNDANIYILFTIYSLCFILFGV